MAKKVVATLKNTSGIKYAKLIRARKSEKNGAYNFKEEIVIEDHVKEILAGKDPQELIEAMRTKQEAAPPPVETKKQEAPAQPSTAAGKGLNVRGRFTGAVHRGWPENKTRQPEPRACHRTGPFPHPG